MNAAEISRIDEAFRRVPRRDFLPPDQRGYAHLDTPLAIGHGATNSQPSTVHTMLTTLDVQPGDRVLDVGSGSGWTTALLAELTGPTGEVLGLELVPELVEAGRAALASSARPWAQIDLADATRLGRSEAGPWDRILVSAAAQAMPTELTDQLADHGRMVLPVARRLMVVNRSGSQLSIQPLHGAWAFVPLIQPPGSE